MSIHIYAAVSPGQATIGVRHDDQWCSNLIEVLGCKGRTHICELFGKFLDQECYGNDCGKVEHDHDPLHQHDNVMSVTLEGTTHPLLLKMENTLPQLPNKAARY